MSGRIEVDSLEVLGCLMAFQLMLRGCWGQQRHSEVLITLIAASRSCVLSSNPYNLFRNNFETDDTCSYLAGPTWEMSYAYVQ